MREIDQDIILNCQKKEIGAFSQMYEFYKDRIYNLCLRMSGNYQEAEDLTQDVFLKVYQKIGEYRFSSSFSSWIYQIATNLCIDKARRAQKITFVNLKETEQDVSDSMEELLYKKEMEVQLQKALTKLKPQYRIYIILRDKEGLTYSEIARILGVNLGTVKSKLNRARMQLAKELKDYKRERSR